MCNGNLNRTTPIERFREVPVLYPLHKMIEEAVSKLND